VAPKPAPADCIGSETCKVYHQDAFEWEHPSVTESCSHCHKPHGSTTKTSSRSPIRYSVNRVTWRPVTRRDFRVARSALSSIAPASTAIAKPTAAIIRRTGRQLLTRNAHEMWAPLALSSFLSGGGSLLPSRVTAQTDPCEPQDSGQGEGGERTDVDPRRRPTRKNLKRIGHSCQESSWSASSQT
jgi:hypothetical protein